MHFITFVVYDNRPGKPKARNLSAMGFNVPSDPDGAKKAVNIVHSAVRKTVDERRGLGKQGHPLGIAAFAVEGEVGDGGLIVPTSRPALIDEVYNLTQDDVDAMKRDWDFEQDKLAILANAGALKA